jgi:hypothetical protein
VEGHQIDESTDQPAGDGQLYDLQGRRVLQPQPGTLYIQNGRKVLWR